MLVTMVDKFAKVPFFISWWAYTFPMDAVTLATTLMYELTHVVFFKVLAGIFMGFTILVILIVFIKTLQAVGRKRICIPEDEGNGIHFDTRCGNTGLIML
jgi:tellurite resistance protein